MSLAFPITQAAFIDKLRFSRFVMECPERVETSVTAAGERLDREIGPRLWLGEIGLVMMTAEEAAEIAALIDLIRGAGGSFLVHDVTRPYPIADPAGLILGGAAPQLTVIASDRRTITIGALPAAYVLTPGDLVGLSYGSAPLRRTLHRVVTGATANGSGVASVEVIPSIPIAILAGAPVTLARPPITAKIVSGSTRPGIGNRFFTEGASFAFAQTMR